MGKNTGKTNYETVLQLVVLAAAIFTPFLASIFMDLELFSVTKSMFTTFCSSMKPWLCPPHIYLLVIFIIFFIVGSSFIRSNTIVFDPATHHNQLPTESFIESYFLCQTHVPGSLSDHDPKFNHTSNDPKTDPFKDPDHDGEGSPDLKKVVPESVVDKRELRKSRTFHEGASRHLTRRERYVRILSQEELDRRVEAFIYKFRKENDVK